MAHGSSYQISSNFSALKILLLPFSPIFHAQGSKQKIKIITKQDKFTVVSTEARKMVCKQKQRK